MVKIYSFLIASISIIVNAEILEPITITSSNAPKTTSDSIDFLSLSEQKFNQMLIQESSPGLYNPIKEGLQGNQILLDVNGIRMSNALFRSGPNQYFSYIPRAFVDSIEEDGLSRLMLNNSLGGEINQKLGVGESKIKMSYIGFNNGFESTITQKSEEFQGGVTWVDTQNHQDTFGEVPHSNYNQKSAYLQSNSLEYNEFTFLISQSNDIPRTDHYANSDPYDYNLQRYILLSDRIDYGKHHLSLSYQRYDEDISEVNSEKITTNDIYGLMYSYELSENINLSISDYFEMISYDDSDFTYNTFDTQLSYETNIADINFIAAYTFSYASIGDDIENDFINHSGLFRVSYESIYASVVQGHRFPSIINLAKSIITEKGIDIANPDLKNETATTYTLAYDNGLFYTKVYYRLLENLITRELLADKVDGKDAYKTINAKSAEMYGGIIGINYDYNDLYTSLYCEYTYGKTDTDYISKITPFHSTLMMQYKDAFIEYRYGAKAKNMSVSDKKDIRIVGHNNGYSITNIGYRFQEKAHELSFILNNIFNQEGRVYASSVDFPKRSVELSYTYRL
ncbi:MAG: hypothetical protein U9R50_06490 [Campylobacterota bacterium]|nr:hypothetical protein [Campylobacterota bacterium]